MGGRDKSQVPLAGQPLLAHVLNSLRNQAGTLALNANGDVSRFAALGLPVFADPVPYFPGPLAGLLAGMVWARDIGAREVLSVPTDVPFLPSDLVDRLKAASDQKIVPKIVLAASAGKRHPTIGLWSTDLAQDLYDFLVSKTTFRVTAFADRFGAVSVEFPMVKLAGREIDPFFNVNTPGDLALAETIMRDLAS
jgi:molybdopterin-guanine dinucleotide biosynthesis protein A